MRSLKDAVEQAAALVVAKRRLEVQMQRTEDLLHREFEAIDQYFEHGKTMHSTVGNMTVDLHYALSMDGQHTCQIEVHDEDGELIGLTWLH